MTKGTIFKASYKTAVYKPNIGGWRQEWVEAVLEATSEKMAIVKEAHLDDADSRRQYFSADGIAKREVGKRKQIAGLYIERE
jgi:hypothetical protein